MVLASGQGTESSGILAFMNTTPVRLWVVVAVAALGLTSRLTAADRPPNVILIVADDLGYSDVGCFGAKAIRTPNIDRMASEGTRFTHFYVSQAVCTASRAALLTGCYANRVSLFGALNHKSRVGIHPNEQLLPELLKARGYATAVYGKWHLGTVPAFLPTRHGFDEWVGLPYSNDNSKYHPVVRDIPPLPLYENETVLERDPDQSQFTRRFTEKAVGFVARNKDRPFFLYVPHVMPHVPVFASAKFRGNSAAGVYGDAVEELDASVGAILGAVQAHGLDTNTLVVFFSDNGPFLSYGTHAGNAAPLREGKLTTFEGGMRVPFVARWPGQVPAGRTCVEVASALDLLPTVAVLAGAGMPKARIDGKDIRPLLLGEQGAKSPHGAFFYYSGGELQAVRSGKWKLHVPHDFLTPAGPTRSDGKPANFEHLTPATIADSGVRGIASRHGYKIERIGTSLFDLSADPSEAKDVSAAHPDIVRRLEELLDGMRDDLGDTLTHRVGRGIRPCGTE